MALWNSNSRTGDMNLSNSAGQFSTYKNIPLSVVRDKLAVSMEIKHGICLDTEACIDSWLKPQRDSVPWNKQKDCKVQKNLLNSLLFCTNQTHSKLQTTASKLPCSDREYLGEVCKERKIHNRPHMKGLSSKSLILIKRMPHKACFSKKSMAKITNSLDDTQLVFVSKECLLIFVNLNFCLHEKYLRQIKLDENTNGNIADPVLIYKRGATFFCDVRSNGLFYDVHDISYDTSVTVYFDVSRNGYVDSIDTELRFVIPNNKSHRDVIPARPISLDPVGIKRLEHNANFMNFCTVAPFYRTMIAQASDDVDKGRPLHHNSRPSRQNISMDQYTFYEPNLTSFFQNQSVDEQNRNRRRQQNVAYENFSTTEERRLSFMGRWPNPSQQQKVKDMVSCGFFYTGTGDLIRCHCCGIGLKDWGELDHPLTEHVRYSPDCQFLIDSIPATRLAHIKASFLPNTVASDRESITPARDGYNTGVETGTTTDEVALSVQPRSPQYRMKAVRLSSFSKWPRDMTQTPLELAEAGFFYTGFNDVVRCYVCDGGLQKWSPEDNPWVEHARWFSHCAYVRQIKGEDFIELVRLSAEHQQLEEEGAAGGMNENTAEQTENIVWDMSGLHISAKNEDLPGSKLKEHNMGEIMTILREVVPECPEATIKEAIADVKMKGEEITADSLMLRITELNARSTHITHRTSSAYSYVTDPETFEELLEETEKLRSVVICEGCKDRNANCLFLPCAHHRFCILCGKDISVCPLCKKVIKNKVKTFMS